MESLGLLEAVADTLVPGVRIGDDGTLRAALAPVARAVEARRPGVAFAAWSRADREALLGELLGAPDAAAALQRVLRVAARTFYGDPAVWPALGYRDMLPGTRWPGQEGRHRCRRARRHRRRLRRGRGGRGRGRRRGRLRAGRGRPARPAGRTGRSAAAGGPAARPPAQRARVDRASSASSTCPWTATRGRGRRGRRSPPTSLWNGNASTVGGGTRVYGAQAWRFCPEDFRMGSTYGVPGSRCRLADRLRRTSSPSTTGRSGSSACAGGRPARPRRPAPARLPDAADGARRGRSRCSARGARALGLATAPVPLLINSRALQRPPGLRPAAARASASPAPPRPRTARTTR